MNVTTALQPGSLDIAIVIPSYSESHTILGKLHSIAVQSAVKCMRIGIFVVVNNSPDAEQEVQDANRNTIALLQHIQAKDDSLEIDEKSPIIMKYTGEGVISKKDLVQRVITDTLAIADKVVLIDASTEGNAILDCNVGKARKLGFEVASQYMDPNGAGLYVSYDADNLCVGESIYEGFKYMSKNLDIAAVGGGWKIARRADTMDSLVYHTFAAAQGTQMLLRDASYLWVVEQGDDYDMPGSNLWVRKTAYDQVGGYRELGFGEDSDLSLRLVGAGFKTRHVDDTKIEVSLRPFSYADSGFGSSHAERMENVKGRNMDEVSIRSADVQARKVAFMETIFFIRNTYTDPDEIREHIAEAFERQFDSELCDEEIDRLLEALDRAPVGYSTHRNPFAMRVVHDCIDARCKKTTLKTEEENILCDVVYLGMKEQMRRAAEMYDRYTAIERRFFSEVISDKSRLLMSFLTAENCEILYQYERMFLSYLSTIWYSMRIDMYKHSLEEYKKAVNDPEGSSLLASTFEKAIRLSEEYSILVDTIALFEPIILVIGWYRTGAHDKDPMIVAAFCRILREFLDEVKKISEIRQEVFGYPDPIALQMALARIHLEGCDIEEKHKKRLERLLTHIVDIATYVGEALEGLESEIAEYEQLLNSPLSLGTIWKILKSAFIPKLRSRS